MDRITEFVDSFIPKNLPKKENLSSEKSLSAIFSIRLIIIWIWDIKRMTASLKP